LKESAFLVPVGIDLF